MSESISPQWWFKLGSCGSWTPVLGHTLFLGLSQSKVNTATPSELSWHVSLLPYNFFLMSKGHCMHWMCMYSLEKGLLQMKNPSLEASIMYHKEQN